MADRTIKVEALTRVEGEGGLHIRLRDDEVEDVRLEIYEPPRLFESLLRGRPIEDVPDITARICGICPVAYQMSSVHALEMALAVRITPEIRRLRRLLYCGEWIESHSLHIYLLNAPDFLGYDGGLEMAEAFPEHVQRGLRMKKTGNRLLEVLGGRAIHPVNVCVGGFYKAPRTEELRSLVKAFEVGLQDAIETVRWVADFDFPEFDCHYDLVALQHEQEYAMNEGEIASTSHGKISVDAYETVFDEVQIPHSTAFHSRRTATGDSYLVGPLARVGLNGELLSPSARRLLEELPIEWPCRNPFRSIIARGLELVHAFEESLEILKDYRQCKPGRVEYQHKAGEGCAATEAPRGLLYHRYAMDADGQVTYAKIVPPTSQNQAQIEADLRQWVPHVLKQPDTLDRLCENLVRCYDPCISCSTHFLRVHLERR